MKRTQNGFTLIELIIALGVMAIFALLAYRGLDSVLRLHQGAYAHEQQAQAIDRVITQLEADLRQASKVTVLAPDKEGAASRLQIFRRIEGSTASELAAVVWVLEDRTLLRRTPLASGEQSAELLTQVSELTWLAFGTDASNSTPTWRVIALPEIMAQATKTLDISRGFGVRLTVAGNALEKVFLVGR
jgi:prepilin-type N-terminal cleavage/methylation domain-containing protein